MSVTVSQRDGFWTKPLDPGGEASTIIRASGTYLSACVPGEWEGPVKVRPDAPGAPSTNSFRVTWAKAAAPDAWRYGVQYRIGSGDWKGWKSGTALKSAIFSGVNGKTYFFRARTTRAVGQRTDWSPARRVVT